MAEKPSQPLTGLFPTKESPVSASMTTLSDETNGMSQSEKEAILRQIHPIFLTTHTEERAPIHQGYFEKLLNFLRLCLEGLLKLVDIVVDAMIQIARLAVWIVAISGILIVVTLMTKTTDPLIDLLNNSVFRYFGIEKKIEKSGTSDTATTPGTTTKANTAATPAK